MPHASSAATDRREPVRGDRLRVRSRAEILATLAPDGTVDGLPFMPEMLQFCGTELPVAARAHKSCDTIEQAGDRRLDRTVFLSGARCDGAAHGGCQAGCLLFWREEWLAWPERPDQPVAPPRSGDGGPLDEPGLHATATARIDDDGTPVYRCQATELVRASAPLRRRELWQYAADLRSRNVGWLRLVRGLLVELFNIYQGISVRRLPRRLRIRGGRPYPFLRGTGTGARTPTGGIAPGDLVEVRSKAEIEPTLAPDNHNRRMVFDPEMLPFCGGRFRVDRKVERILDERTGRLMKLADCVVLEDVFCQGVYHRFCQRSTPPYWRETWLRRLPDATED
ncbi:MAG: hypothetical protein ACRDT2_10230 [Natronosporangium sp.]